MAKQTQEGAPPKETQTFTQPPMRRGQSTAHSVWLTGEEMPQQSAVSNNDGNKTSWRHETQNLTLQWLLSISLHTTQQRIQNKHKVQHREAEWTWSGLCGGESWFQRRCRRTEYLHCDPGTLQLWRTEDLRQEFGHCCNKSNNCLCYNLTSKICHWIQIHIHLSSLLCWYSCMWLLHKLLLLSTPPPSNNVQSVSLYSGPDPSQWICLGD